MGLKATAFHEGRGYAKAYGETSSVSLQWRRG